MDQRSKNDIAWEALFEQYHILEEIDSASSFRISADQIRAYREPRLMAKFDHKINLPAVFAANQLSILPVSRGDYLIARFQAYHPFEPFRKAVQKVALPPHLQSLSARSITSESIAINCALASGILADFLREKNLVPTVSGRMGSERFAFEISLSEGQLARVEVNNSQIEIDAAFEGEKSLALLEAKRDISEDFLVRQLYYPFRTWRKRVTKAVRPIFLVYSNGIFSLYEYLFDPYDRYHALRLVRQRNYSIEDTRIEKEDLAAVMRQIIPRDEPPLAFPQADRFERVINLCELLGGAPCLTREDVTQRYAFDIRQTNYYTDAGRYLGLIQKGSHDAKPAYSLTERGKTILSLGYKQRQLELCRCILEHRVFLAAFYQYLNSGEFPDKNEIIRLMKQANLYRVHGESTYYRRASTVSSWLQWMIRLMG